MLNRIIASGFLPTTSSKIWLREYDDWDGGPELHANVLIGIEDAALAVPVNDPPNVAYTLLPRSAIVQVTKEHEPFDALLKFVPRAESACSSSPCTRIPRRAAEPNRMSKYASTWSG
ncbi:hypothetical protein [Nocardia sp. NPDC004750]